MCERVSSLISNFSLFLDCSDLFLRLLFKINFVWNHFVFTEKLQSSCMPVIHFLPNANILHNSGTFVKTEKLALTHNYY